MSQIHVIDPDLSRRNDLARTIMRSQRHAEIYENYDEFLAHNPGRGLALVADEVGVYLQDTLMKGEIEMPFVMYGSRPAPADVFSALRAGALDYLVWPDHGTDIAALLDRLLREGEKRAEVIAKLQDARRRVARLSRREKEVLQLIMAGNANKEIAYNLEISPRTVEIHRANAMSKIGARSPADAVRIAICGGLDDTLKVIW